jgi:hypothetical protein
MFGQRGGACGGQVHQPDGFPVPVCPAHRATTGTVRDTRCGHGLSGSGCGRGLGLGLGGTRRGGRRRRLEVA